MTKPLKYKESSVKMGKDPEREKSGAFKKGHGGFKNRGSKAMCSMTKRASLIEKFKDNKLTDPLDFLLSVVHNKDKKGEELGYTTGERMDAAKSSVPYVYSKAPLDVNVSNEERIEISDVDEKLRQLFGDFSQMAKQADEKEDKNDDETAA